MNRLKHSISYLAGPMDRISWDDATQWRNIIKPELRKIGVGIIDPCDKPLENTKEDKHLHAKVKQLKTEGKLQEVRDIYRPICGVDLRFVDLSSFIIALVDIDSHMCGTYHEIFTAISQKKPVLCMIKQGIEHVPNWLCGVMPVEHMFSTWKELITYLKHINNDKDVDHMKRWTFLDHSKVWGHE